MNKEVVIMIPEINYIDVRYRLLLSRVAKYSHDGFDLCRVSFIHRILAYTMDLIKLRNLPCFQRRLLVKYFYLFVLELDSLLMLLSNISLNVKGIPGSGEVI